MSASAAEPAKQQLPSKNPIPLSVAQEEQVKKLYHKNIRAYCADEIRDFAQCASGRSFSIMWTCRMQKLAMNSCMIAHAGPDEEDRAREEYFAGAPMRRVEKEEKERKKAQDEKFHREWWEFDERERARKRKRAESVQNSR